MIKREKLPLIRNSKYLYLLFFIFTMASCMDEVEDIIEEDDDEEQVIFDDTDFEATDWTEATHSKDADPNFDEVFEDQAVKRLDIVITEDRWQTMLDDMTDLYGTFGSRGGAGGGGPGGGPGPRIGPGIPGGGPPCGTGVLPCIENGALRMTRLGVSSRPRMRAMRPGRS